MIVHTFLKDRHLALSGFLPPLLRIIFICYHLPGSSPGRSMPSLSPNADIRKVIQVSVPFLGEMRKYAPTGSVYAHQFGFGIYSLMHCTNSLK